MKKKFEYKERRGLPGGPNEYITHVSGIFSVEGYKSDSPDVNNPYNIIPSGDITMKGVDFPVMGTDNLGNTKAMIPGNDYQFPGDVVFETPMYKNGGGLLTKTMKCKSCNWSWKAADGGNDVDTCHKCGGKALPTAQGGAEKKIRKVGLQSIERLPSNFYPEKSDRLVKESKPVAKPQPKIPRVNKYGQRIPDVNTTDAIRQVDEYEGTDLSLAGQANSAGDYANVAWNVLTNPVDAISASLSPGGFENNFLLDQNAVESEQRLGNIPLMDWQKNPLAAVVSMGTYAIPGVGAIATGKDLYQEGETFYNDPSLANAGMLGLSAAGIKPSIKELQNLYKYNPRALKEIPYTTIARIQKPGQTAELALKKYYNELEAAGKRLSPKQKLESLKVNREGYGQGFSKNPRHLSYYSNPNIQQSRGYQGDSELLVRQIPTKELKNYNVKSLTNEFQKSYGSTSPSNEFILPYEEILKAEKWSPDRITELQKLMKEEQSQKPHWLKGYQVGKNVIKNAAKYTDEVFASSDDIAKTTVKDAKPRASRFDAVTEVNPLSQAQAKNLAKQGRNAELFKAFEEGANTIDDFVKSYTGDLSSPEGFKRLVDQEADYLRSIGFNEAKIATQAEINAGARLNEIVNIGNTNRAISKGDIPAKTVISNNYNFNNASYTPTRWSAEYIDDLFFQPGTDISNSNFLLNKTKIGAKVLPGKTNLGTMYNSSKAVAAHEIGGHGLQSGRKLPVDSRLKKLEPLDELNDNAKAAYNYFLNGSKGQESSAFLHELRQAMLDNKLIRNRYDYVSPEQLKRAQTLFDLRPSGTVNTMGNKFHSDTRILDFMKPTKSNFDLLARELNKLPAMVPIGVAGAAGAAALPQEKYGGESLYKAQDGNGEYKVQSGDTFYGIANKNNISWEDLQKANPGIDIEKLKLNQTIKFPTATKKEAVDSVPEIGKVTNAVEEVKTKTATEKTSELNLEGLKKGIAQAESLGGVLMLNPQSTATGLYGQRFSELKGKDLYKGTREEFAEDIEAQNRIFDIRLNQGIDGKRGLIQDAEELYEEYKPQIEGFDYSKEDLIGLTNFLGRQGTRYFLGYHLRDGKPLHEALPKIYSDSAKQANKKPDEYLKVLREYYKAGGETTKLSMYKNYMKGDYDGTEMESEAEKVFDKLNRVYYRQAKALGMNAPNYIMSKIIPQG